MAKKIVITSIAIIFLSLFCGFCLAAEGDMKMNVNDLGNGINETLDKAGQTVKNVTDDVVSGNVMDKAKNGLDKMDTKTKEGINDIKNTGAAGVYNITRTDATIDSAVRSDNIVWVWMIIAVLMILKEKNEWMYVSQNNERR